MIFKIDYIPEDKQIILFDGICNLCNNAIDFIIKKDKNDIFLYTTLQSETGKSILKELQIDTSKTDSVILYNSSESYYIKSKAVIEISKEIGGIWRLMAIFSILPTTFNNFVYDFIAKNRYNWFGKQDNCRIPTPELTSKFLS